MNFLLDTCAVSELARPRPNPGVLEWAGTQDESTLYLSVVTMGEIQKGISMLGDAERQRLLREWLQRSVAERFEGRLLELDADILLPWGKSSESKPGEEAPFPWWTC